jgi:copper oxidase (laccase) domain-containing protein
VNQREVPTPAPLDLRAALARSAVGLGVREVTVSGLCTREHPAFHSHRGSGGAVGRMAAYVGRVRA